MGRYAQNTSVPADRSRAEIERALTRYGATAFGYHWERREVPIDPPKTYGPKTEQREYAYLMFDLKKTRIQLGIPMPTERELHSRRSDALGQAQRQRWRAALLVIKAKLEAVESGISTLEQEFLSGIVTQDGRTIGDIVIPRLSEAVRSGRLLPAAGETR